MDSRIVQVIRVAKGRLSSPAKWCKGAFARNAAGSACDELGKDARQFSLTGALVRAEQELRTGASVYPAVVVAVLKALPSGTEHMDEWNDRADVSHADVLAALNMAAHFAAKV